MSTLNPDLISKDMDAVLNDAVPMLGEYRKSSIMPEMVLLALLPVEKTQQPGACSRCSNHRAALTWSAWSAR